MWFDTGGSNVNRVGWLECDGAEDLRSRRRCWLELLSSAGEERGPWPAEETFLRVSVKRRNSSVNEKRRKCILIPKWVVRGRKKSKSRGNNPAVAFSPSHKPAPCCPPGHLGWRRDPLYLCTASGVAWRWLPITIWAISAPLPGSTATCGLEVWPWPSGKVGL